MKDLHWLPELMVEHYNQGVLDWRALEAALERELDFKRCAICRMPWDPPKTSKPQLPPRYPTLFKFLRYFRK